MSSLEYFENVLHNDASLVRTSSLLSIDSACVETFLKLMTSNTNARETHSRATARELFNDFPITIDFKASLKSPSAASILKKQYGYSTR